MNRHDTVFTLHAYLQHYGSPAANRTLFCTGLVNGALLAERPARKRYACTQSRQLNIYFVQCDIHTIYVHPHPLKYVKKGRLLLLVASKLNVKSQNERFPADIDDIAGRFRTRFSLSPRLLSCPKYRLVPHLMLLSHSIAVPTIHEVRGSSQQRV